MCGGHGARAHVHGYTAEHALEIWNNRHAESSTETLTRDDVQDDETGGWSLIPALREGDVCRIERVNR